MDRRTTESALLIDLGGRWIEYRFVRRRRRTIGIAIDSNGLSVSAPMRAAWRDIEAFLRHKERWIVRKLDEWGRLPRPAIVRGRSGDYPTFNFAIARYTDTGQLDQTFGTGGKVLTAASNDSNGYALTIAGSKITLAGAVANSQSPFDFGVARYLAR